MEIDLSEINLRRFALTDAEEFLVWAGDDRVTRNQPWRTLTSKEEALAFIEEKCIPHPWRRLICVGHRSIGFVSASPGAGDDRFKADIAYGLAFEYWGKGIGTRAIEIAKSQIFEEFPHLVRLQAFVLMENKASQRVLEKTGFQREGLLRRFVSIKGTLFDVYIYSFLSSDLPSC